MSSESKKELKDFGSTHHVKKLLETYIGTAGHTLTGPSGHSSLEEPPYKQNARQQHYKLPPDVELSKTNNDEDNDIMSDKQKDPNSSSGFMLDGKIVKMEADKGSNGMVTLSRIDDSESKGGRYSKADWFYTRPIKSPNSSLNSANISTISASEIRQRFVEASNISPNLGGSNAKHLSGDMIRRLRQHGGNPEQLVPVSNLGNPATSGLKLKSNLSIIQVSNATNEKAGKYVFKRPSNSDVGGESATVVRGIIGGESTVGRGTISGPQASSASAGPLLSVRDNGVSEVMETTLGGEQIAAFSIGGELRLCLPQILNTVLDSISLQAIHHACDELRIFCSTCSPGQLEVLKQRKVLPITAYQCGLITKSDAERLCSTLLDRNPPRASMSGFNAKSSPFSFKVEHECFGKCEGLLLPEACTSVQARCIECLQCEGLFSPAKFVCHAHNTENRTCHWGFDSANWRSYLHLWEGYTTQEKERLERRFCDFKSRFASLTNCLAPKRKANGNSPSRNSLSASSPSSLTLPAKKARLSSDCEYSVSPPTVATIVPAPTVNPAAKSATNPTVNPPPGMPPFFPPNDPYNPYSIYLYNTWAAAAAASAAAGTAGGGKPHPMQAWAASMAQAMKEGKAPPPPSMFPGGLPPPPPSSVISPSPAVVQPQQQQGQIYRSSRRRSSSSPPSNYQQTSSSGHQGNHHGVHIPSHHHNSNSQVVVRSASVKSSPHSSANSPQDQPMTSRIPGQGYSLRESPPPSGVASSTPLAISQHHRRSSSKSSSSLVEDIQTIRTALDGASSSARERTLKILERLTARLAIAEQERDSAIAELVDLQKRYRVTADELHKKRAELRELLQQDNNGHEKNHPESVPIVSDSRHQDHQVTGEISGSNGKSSVTLELLADMRSRSSGVGGGGDINRKTTSGYLPKVELKSPARIIEEKELPPNSNSNTSANRIHVFDRRKSLAVSTGNENPSASPLMSPTNSGISGSGFLDRPGSSRHRSGGGTPTSTKSKDSEDLRDRVNSLESELKFLRDAMDFQSRMRQTAMPDRRRSEAGSPTPLGSNNRSGNLSGNKIAGEENDEVEEPEAKSAKISAKSAPTKNSKSNETDQ